MKAIFWVFCFLTVMAIMLLIGTLMSVEWYMDRGEEVPLSIYAWQAAVAGWLWLLWKMKRARRVISRHFEREEDTQQWF